MADGRPNNHSGPAPYWNNAVSNTLILVADGQVNLYNYEVYNGHTAAVYLQLFDAAAAADVTLGTTNPKREVVIPATSRVAFSAATGIIQFDKGLVIAATATSKGAGAPAVAQHVNIGYRD